MKLIFTSIICLSTLVGFSQSYTSYVTNANGTVNTNTVNVAPPTATFISPTGVVLSNTTFSVTTTALIDQMAQDATNRAVAAASGADIARAIQLYQENYNNDAYWKNFWTGTATSATWLDEIRVLNVVCSNSVAHLQGSLNWFANAADLTTLDGKPIKITKQYSYPNITTYTATINGRTITTSDWTSLKTQLMNTWVAQQPTADIALKTLDSQATFLDPNGSLLQQDYNIINNAAPNASTYELSLNGLHPADSTILSLLIDTATASNNTANMTNVVDVTSTVDTPTNATFSQVYGVMVDSGAIIPPAAIKAPSDAIQGIRVLYSRSGDTYKSSATNPVYLRDNLLALLFSDLMQGRWNGNTFVFTRPVRHTSAYLAYWSSYVSSCNELIAYYQSIIHQLNIQISDANTMDQTIIAQTGDYQNNLNNQAPIGSAINTGQATQLFNQQVQPANTSFPLIGMSSYLIWLLGPPWAETPGWQIGPYYQVNPLYYTIVAQYVRGLVSNAGMSIQPQNVAENALKAGNQQNQAINDIMDLANKSSSLLNVSNMLGTYGNQSQHIHTTAMGSSISSTPTYTNTFDPVAGAAMAGVNHSRSNSAALEQQQQQTYTLINSDQTLLQRAAIKNQQELTKTATMKELQTAINNRAVMKAMGRNQDIQDTNNSKELNSSLNQGVLQ